MCLCRLQVSKLKALAPLLVLSDIFCRIDVTDILQIAMDCPGQAFERGKPLQESADRSGLMSAFLLVEL